MTGKVNYKKWSQKLGIDLVAQPDAMATLPIAIPVLVRGMMEGAFTGAALPKYINESKSDFYNARRVINGIIPSQVSKYLNLAAYYKTRINDLYTAATSAQPVEPAKPVDKVVKSDVVTVQQPTAVKVPEATPTAQPGENAIKGNTLVVEWDNVEFEFFHTGTDVSNDGITVLTGQGLRWVLNRRKRTASMQGIKFSDLAARVGRTQGITVEYQAAFDPTFLVVEQRGISDYALLKREAGNAGLFISEEPGKITIKSITQIKDTSIVLAEGDNLLKWTCKDRAIDADDSVDAASDPLLTKEVKGVIDPLTGKLRQNVPDIDSAKATNTVTGASPGKSEPKAIKTPGQDLTATQQIQRYKRVKGLPSTFVIVQTPRILELTPLSAIRTKGLSKFLDRVWLLDKITHNTDGTSTLDCFSPVDVLDITPPATTTANGAAITTAVTTATPGKFQVPCDGTVTSQVGIRSAPTSGASSNHKGTDIANSVGTPIIATLDGIVSVASVQDGYGNVVYLKHANGWESRYGHLSKILVTQNAQVKQGQVIGLMGNTGRSTGSHLHFEVRDSSGNARNPSEYGLPSINGIGSKAVKGATS